MRMLLACGYVLLVLSLPGCGKSDEAKKTAAAERPTLLPAIQSGVRIVLEAEAGAVEAPVVVEEFQPVAHPERGMEAASGGKCVAVPNGANDADKENPKGKVTLKFTVPAEKDYYIYPRVWWRDGCGNSFTMTVDGARPLTVTDSTYLVWHWMKLMSDDERSLAPRAFRLQKGEHVLGFGNREDGSKLDQVYITDDPNDEPADIMKVTE